MTTRWILVTFAVSISGAGLACRQAALAQEAQRETPRRSLESAIAPPPGFSRRDLPAGSFGTWLRQLPLREDGAPVRLHDGSLKANQSAHAAVVAIDVGAKDLQQCADAVIRLRAEYLFGTACRDEIRFDFTSGDAARWDEWRDGVRAHVNGNRVSWRRSAAADDSYASFRAYLDSVFTYAGSVSLERELTRVADPRDVRPGDVYIQGGFPGHAVLVVDIAESQEGEKVFLLAQSYMPAQEIHILRSFDEISPWYAVRTAGELVTPEWTFRRGDLRRFARTSCEPAATASR